MWAISIFWAASSSPRAWRMPPSPRFYRMLLALASTAKVLYPDFQVSDMLTDQALPAYRRLAQDCGGGTGPAFSDAAGKPGWGDKPLGKGIFFRNSPGSTVAPSPPLVFTRRAGFV